MADLPAHLLPELFMVTKDTSPEFSMHSIGELKYYCYSSWIDEVAGSRKKRAGNSTSQL